MFINGKVTYYKIVVKQLMFVQRYSFAISQDTLKVDILCQIIVRKKSPLELIIWSPLGWYRKDIPFHRLVELREVNPDVNHLYAHDNDIPVIQVINDVRERFQKRREDKKQKLIEADSHPSNWKFLAHICLKCNVKI